jgi:DNA-binding FadR family transcriptional regulator
MSSPLTPLEPKRLYRQIADVLREHIEGGRFPVGSLLPPERELAVQLGVSRTSVREALVALEVEGRVAVKVGNGVTVLAPADAAVEAGRPGISVAGHGAAAEPWVDVGPIEVLEVRLLIEPEAASLAAEHATKADLAELRTILGTLLGEAPPVASQGADTALNLHWADDRRFHEQIARASGKPIYERIVTLLWNQRTSPLYRKFDEIFTDQAMVEASQNDHQQVFKAIVARDADWARLCMRRHLDRVKATYLRSL